MTLFMHESTCSSGGLLACRLLTLNTDKPPSATASVEGSRPRILESTFGSFGGAMHL